MNFEDIKEEDLFAIDKRGYRIYCDDEQMDHIYAHHPELTNFWADENDIKLAIEDALVIFQSRKGSEYNIYYLRRYNNRPELKVVVRLKGEKGIIWAVQPLAQRQPGENLIWQNTNP